MNLTGLQMELRVIEERVSALQVEIEKMKPRPEKEKRNIYEKITKLAVRFPIENSYVAQESFEMKKAYISCLSYLAMTDEAGINEKLLYLGRLSAGIGRFFPAEDILRMGMQVNRVYFEIACSELMHLKYSFITDALILGNITEKGSDAALSRIADIAEIMDCDKGELAVMSYVAKAVLTQDDNILEQIPVCGNQQLMRQLQHYIPDASSAGQRLMTMLNYISGTRK